MINAELIAYIKNELIKGTASQLIRSALMSQGWSMSDIDEGLRAAGFQSIPVPPIPVSPIPISPININTQTITESVNNLTLSTYAGFWSRFVAAVFDGAIISFISALISFTCFWFFVKNNPSLNNSMQSILGIISFIIWIIYFPFIESRGGVTLGKKLVGIKVTTINGEPVRFLRSLGRNFAKIISAIIFMIGFIMAGFTKKKQALHDMIAGCVVVKTKEVSVAKLILIIALVVIAWGGIVFLAGAQLFSILFSSFNEMTIPNSSGIDGDMYSKLGQTDSNGISQNDSSSTPAFAVVSASDYDTYMSKPIIGLGYTTDYKGPHTFAGPALIAFDDFFGLNVAMPIIPNLENNKDYVWIDLTSVTSKDGKEILDQTSNSFENDMFFKSLSLKKETDPVEYLQDYRQIHLITNVELSAVATIKGTLFFKIPLSSANSQNFYEKSYPFTINVAGK